MGHLYGYAMLDVEIEIETEARVKRAEGIFKTYGKEIRAMISLNVAEQSMADDIFQNLFLSVVQKPIPLHIDRIEAYLYRLITNDIIDETRKTDGYYHFVRRYGQHNYHQTRQEPPDDGLMEIESACRMLQFIERHLPCKEAKAMICRYVHGNNVSDGAREMNMNSRTFSRYISRGKRRIRQLFEKGKGDR